VIDVNEVTSVTVCNRHVQVMYTSIGAKCFKNTSITVENVPVRNRIKPTEIVKALL